MSLNVTLQLYINQQDLLSALKLRMGWAAQQRSTESCTKKHPGWSMEGQHQPLHLQSPGFPAQLWILWFWGHLFAQSQACLSWRVGFTVLTIKVTEDAARSWRLQQSDSQLACTSDSPGKLFTKYTILGPSRTSEDAANWGHQCCEWTVHWGLLDASVMEIFNTQRSPFSAKLGSVPRFLTHSMLATRLSYDKSPEIHAH